VNALSALGVDVETGWNKVNQTREHFFAEAQKCGDEEVEARTCISVICDLKLQGWRLQVTDETILAAQHL
jgi:hypothetical protein